MSLVALPRGVHFLDSARCQNRATPSLDQRGPNTVTAGYVPRSAAHEDAEYVFRILPFGGPPTADWPSGKSCQNGGLAGLSLIPLAVSGMAHWRIRGGCILLEMRFMLTWDSDRDFP